MIDDSKIQSTCSRQRNRRCLMCGALFRSDGPHHRICPRCKLSRRWREGDMAYPTHDRRGQS